jgi:hypothetical protein
MPANASPKVILALGQAAAARALGIRVERIRDALDSGALVCRQLGNKHRIPVFGPLGLQEWFDSWPLAERKQRN